MSDRPCCWALANIPLVSFGTVANVVEEGGTRRAILCVMDVTIPSVPTAR